MTYTYVHTEKLGSQALSFNQYTCKQYSTTHHQKFDHPPFEHTQHPNTLHTTDSPTSLQDSHTYANRT